MESQHAEEIVKLFEFQNWRIVIVNDMQNIDLIAYGEEWIEPEDRSIAEDKTIYLMLGDGHFYWLKFPKQTIFKKYRPTTSGSVKNCYRCFQTMTTSLFDNHLCELRTKESFECDKCTKQCSNSGSLKQHQRKPEDYAVMEAGTGDGDFEPDCPNCQVAKKDFYSLNCFNHHLFLCNGQEDLPNYCELCQRKYTADHDCDDWGKCNNCQETFTNKDSKYDHRCTFQKIARFHEPIVTFKGRQTWKPHWVYDFETYRSQEEGIEIYKHDVMAWSIQLVKPNEEIVEYMKEHDYYSKYTKSAETQQFEYTLLGNTPRFHGKDMKSFLKCCESLTVTKGLLKTLPTFWAHNGARVRTNKLNINYLV